jgi:hypothetical protein
MAPLANAKVQYRSRHKSGGLAISLSDTVDNMARQIAVLPPLLSCIWLLVCMLASRIGCWLRALLNALHGQEAVGVESANLRVVFKAARLEGTRQLAEYDINDGDVVHLVLPKRGWLYLAAHGSVLEVTATSSMLFE